MEAKDLVLLICNNKLVVVIVEIVKLLVQQIIL